MVPAIEGRIESRRVGVTDRRLAGNIFRLWIRVLSRHLLLVTATAVLRLLNFKSFGSMQRVASC